MLCEQFDAKAAEIRQLMRGNPSPLGTTDLIDEMRQAIGQITITSRATLNWLRTRIRHRRYRLRGARILAI